MALSEVLLLCLWQGLSHYLEHMLFMGSTKYPDENEYEVYLTKHGGFSNAYTELVGAGLSSVHGTGDGWLRHCHPIKSNMSLVISSQLKCHQGRCKLYGSHKFGNCTSA